MITCSPGIECLGSNLSSFVLWLADHNLIFFCSILSFCLLLFSLLVLCFSHD